MDPLAAYADYVEGSLRLMIHYARHLTSRRNPPVPMAEALETRTDILRKTAHFDGRHPAYGLEPRNAAWDDLKAQLAERILAHAETDGTNALEEECWSLLHPLVEPILPESYAHSLQIGRGPYGCWRFDIRDNDPDAINLHVCNAYQPASPFDAEYRPRLVHCLLQLLRDAQAAHPHAIRLRCSSWLNQLPPFLALFPPSWRASFVASDYSSGTAGHWGQYMDHRGAFHRYNGAAVASTPSPVVAANATSPKRFYTCKSKAYNRRWD